MVRLIRPKPYSFYPRLREGGDGSTIPIPCTFASFYPRLREGGDSARRGKVSRTTRFLPTPPRGRRQER